MLDVTVTNDPSEAERWFQQHIYDPDVQQPVVGRPYVGLDGEWPSWTFFPSSMSKEQRDQRQRLAILQLSANDGKATLVLLVQQIRGGLPPSLRRLLCDPDVVKTGVEVRADGIKLVVDYPELGLLPRDLRAFYDTGLLGGRVFGASAPCEVEEEEEEEEEVREGEDNISDGAAPMLESKDPILEKVGHSSAALIPLKNKEKRTVCVDGGPANRLRLGDRIGLSRLVAMACSVTLRKDKSLQRSNWDATTLTPHQVHYAAMDAIASNTAYEFLNKCGHTIESQVAPEKKSAFKDAIEHCLVEGNVKQAVRSALESDETLAELKRVLRSVKVIESQFLSVAFFEGVDQKQFLPGSAPHKEKISAYCRDSSCRILRNILNHAKMGTTIDKDFQRWLEEEGFPDFDVPLDSSRVLGSFFDDAMAASLELKLGEYLSIPEEGSRRISREETSLATLDDVKVKTFDFKSKSNMYSIRINDLSFSFSETPSLTAVHDPETNKHVTRNVHKVQLAFENGAVFESVSPPKPDGLTLNTKLKKVLANNVSRVVLGELLKNPRVLYYVYIDLLHKQMSGFESLWEGKPTKKS